MTKSRTLRKAAAVALSLAMAFSVATVSTDASAAAKPSLKKTKVSVKVKKSVKVGIKNYKLVKKLTVKSKNSKIAKAAKVGKKAVKITGVKAGTTKVTVTIKYGKKTLKKNINVTVKPISTTNEDNTQVIEGKITIESDAALQADGSVLKNDLLKATIPAGLGVFQDIVWTCSGKTMNTSGFGNTGALQQKATEAGEWQLLAVTSKGTTYASNKLTVVDKEVAGKLEGFEILNDYDTKIGGNGADKDNVGKNVDYVDKSKKLVAHFTVNRLYDGDYGVVDPAASTKAATHANDVLTVATNNNNTTLKINNIELAKLDSVGSLADVSGAKLTGGAAAAGAYVGGLGKKTEIYYVLDDEFITRGKGYAGFIDQKSIATDTVGKGSENLSATATAPYVQAPTSFVITSFESDTTAKMELRGEDGKALAWMNAAAGNYAVTLKGCSKDNNVIATTDSLTAINGAVAKGVITGNGTFNNRYLYATAELAKGVYGAEPVTLTATLVEKAGKPADKIVLSQSSTTATSATVAFTNLKSDAAGTVYVFQGDATNNDFDKISKLDTSKAKGSAAVVGGAGTVEVTGVFKEVSNSANAAAENSFVAVFVPTDAAKYTKLAGGKDANTVFTLAQTFKKYAALGATLVSATTADASGAVAKGVDQFGKEIAAAKVNGEFELTNTAATKNNKIKIIITAGEIKVLAADGTSALSTDANILVGEEYAFTTTAGNVIKVKIKDIAATPVSAGTSIKDTDSNTAGDQTLDSARAEITIA